jgi:hypothetical protein
MKKILLPLCLLPLAATAQNVTFETHDYQSVGVYDTWQQSPFRTGQLQGNVAVTANPSPTMSNPSGKVLGFQRSRYASNVFGARIELKSPFSLSPTGKYVHVLINRPLQGRVMLVGLGKRHDRLGQSKEAEQFWVYSTTEVPTGEWADAVFPIKSAPGVDIYSLVVVPHAESTHDLKDDALVYIDNLLVDDSPAPRISFQHDKNATAATGQYKPGDKVTVIESDRNGYMTAEDGSKLNNYQTAYGQPFKIKVVPAPGFSYTGIVIRHGIHQKEETVDRNQIGNDNIYTVPAEFVDGNILIEGLFVSTSK